MTEPAARSGSSRRGKRGGRRRRRRRSAAGSGEAPNGSTPPKRGRRPRSARDGDGRRAEGPPTLADARRVARDQFGIGRLRPEQVESMEALLAGRDVLTVLPTGYGKSLIYQVPALLLDGPTVVVSPLIALMRDQESSLRAKHVPVVRLDSTLRAETRRQHLSRITKGGPLVVLTTPETLEKDDARAALEQGKPKLLCVDEAHCISEWGHDFRPAYLSLGAERQELGITQVLALTATATPRVQRDIHGRLRLDDPEIIVAPCHRPNLRLSCHIAPGGYKIEHAGRILRRLRRPGIVYCATTVAVDEIYGALVKARIPCSRYHGKMKTDERNRAQSKFMKDGTRMVMVATSAFGMGIDKADIRYIMHYQVPASPEQYIQEAGRAGRDGRPAHCILLFDPSDLEIQRFLQKKSRPAPRHLRRVADALAAWAEEEKPVNAKDLALSAEVAQTTCRSMCTQLEDAGLVTRDIKRRFTANVSPDELRAGAIDLGQRFEIERREDEHRLTAITEYAETEECRSVFIRKWFGEEDPPSCGKCDRCQERGTPDPEADSDGQAKRRGRRGGRRGGGRGRRGGRGGRGRRKKKTD